MKYLKKCEKDCITLSRDCYGLVKGKKCTKIHKDYLRNVENRYGVSLLHLAAETDNTKLIKFILDHRVNDVTDTDLLNSLLNLKIGNELKYFISEMFSLNK